jgi:glutathione peroxidase
MSMQVNGSNETPLYSFLKSKSGGLLGSDVKWNFEKVLVDKAGNVVKRYGSMTNPMSIENDIKALL